MWRTDTLWFDAAVVLGIFAFGNIGFGHFEEHKPKWRRLLKVVLVLAIMLTLSATAGRVWAYTFLALPLIGAAVVHLWWLPRNGVNGWTGEPKERYYQLIGHTPRTPLPRDPQGA
ncbi:MAG TPA: hypothetical protein VMW27_02065 [Thermoanaerobaculia bacterium]|nr:hypothetical protein [Thermoanaerobaculia bacterium]